MMNRIAEAGPRARTTGVVFLLFFLTAIASVLLTGRLAVYGNAANLVSTACYVVVTLLFYFMFKPVSGRLSLIAAIVSLAGCALTFLDAFHRAPAHVSPLAFFGPYCLLIGYLILRSTFLPRALGLLMMLDGVGWLSFVAL